MLDDTSELSRVFQVATDEEADMLQEVAAKAGILWKCGECGDYNPAEDEKCGGCGDYRDVPPCVKSMRCLCAGHARGNPPSAECDTSE